MNGASKAMRKCIYVQIYLIIKKYVIIIIMHKNNSNRLENLGLFMFHGRSRFEPYWGGDF